MKKAIENLRYVIEKIDDTPNHQELIGHLVEAEEILIKINKNHQLNSLVLNQLKSSIEDAAANIPERQHQIASKYEGIDYWASLAGAFRGCAEAVIKDSLKILSIIEKVKEEK